MLLLVTSDHTVPVTQLSSLFRDTNKLLEESVATYPWVKGSRKQFRIKFSDAPGFDTEDTGPAFSLAF